MIGKKLDNREVNSLFESMKPFDHDESKKRQVDIMDSSLLLRWIHIETQHILLHPFINIRRTCQVNRKCSPTICVQPFSLIPFIFHQQRKQGLFAFYRGLTSELLVKGLALGTETAIANYLEWPTEIVKPKRYLQDSFKVLTLRAISIALTTPFLCSAVIQTIQSVIILRERPSFIDCLKDGFLRLIHLRSNSSSRMLPIWLLVIPTICFHLSRKVLLEASTKLIAWSKEHFAPRSLSQRKACLDSAYLTDEPTLGHDIYSNVTQTNPWTNETDLGSTRCDLSLSTLDALQKESDQISTSILANLIADVLLLPCETVLHSIYIQGTRTIIDNCDETTMVLPVLTNYDGFLDCMQSIIKFEGRLGLFKGLGAIVLQYTVHFLFLRYTFLLLKEFKKSGDENSKRRKPGRKIRPTLQATRVDSGLIDNNRHSTPNADYVWLRQPEEVYSASPLRYDGLTREFEQ